MIVKTIHGEGSHVESFEGNMLITNCNVVVEENVTEELKDIKMINSIVKLNDKTFYTNDKGEIYHMETKSKKVTGDDFYKNEGIAIFVKGQMMIGIHPDNLENNTRALNNGEIKVDWELLLSRAKGTEPEHGKAILEVKNNK